MPPSLPTAPAPAPRTTPFAAPMARRGSFLRNNVVLVIVVAVVLGGGGIALATGKPSRPSLDLTSAPAAPVTTAAAPVTTQAPRVRTDAGVVSGLSYGAITITHPDGTVATLIINAATRYRPARLRPKVGGLALVYSTAGKARVIAPR